MNRLQHRLGLLLVCFLLVGCATTPSTAPMTPKEQATYFLKAYNSQYDSTMALATKTNATPAEKDYVVKKKAMLTEVWPLIKAYASVIDSGGKPTQEATDGINRLIDRLTSIALGGK